MAELFNGQRVVGVRLVDDGETMFNNQPVIGVIEADVSVTFTDNQLVMGVDVLDADAAIHNTLPVLGAVVISDGRDVYNGRLVAPARAISGSLGFVEYTWASEWTASVGTNEGSQTGQQFRGLRADGSGRVWSSGGLVTYNGAATPEEYLNSTALTVTPGPTATQKVNMIAVAHAAADGAHQVATMIGNTNSYSRCYAVTHDEANGFTYIAGRAGEHMHTVAGAFQASFEGDGNPNGLYGPQDCYIARIITATGVVDKASYFGVAAEGDFFRDLVFNPADGYLYAGRAKFGNGSPVIATQLLKIEPDLSGVVATFDFGNDASTEDGQPSIVVRGTDLWIHFNTSVAVTNGVPLPGAFQETFGSGSHFRGYIGLFDLSGGGLDFVQGTYVRTLTGTAATVGATHTIDWTAHDGGSIIMAIGCGLSCDLPTYGTPQYQAAIGPSGGCYFGHISGDLSTMLYGTYLHSNTSSERVANSSIRASGNGKRVLIPFEADGPWDTTDGSSNPGGLGSRRQLSVIMRRTEADTGWEAEFVHYSELGALYASEFDTEGNAYVAGFLANSGNPIPFVERFTPTVFVPPPTLTAATVVTHGTDGLLSTSPLSVDILIPVSASEGDYMVITSTVRNGGTMTASHGTKVGQVNALSNFGMAGFYYQVQAGDPGVTSITVSCATAFSDFSVSWVLVTGAAGIEATSAPAQEVAFGATCRAGDVTTANTNSLVIFAVGQLSSNTYSSSTYTELHEATIDDAGLAAFSHLAADVGVAGPFDVTASGSGNSYGWTIAFTGT